jgi:hypothetical protein
MCVNFTQAGPFGLMKKTCISDVQILFAKYNFFSLTPAFELDGINNVNFFGFQLFPQGMPRIEKSYIYDLFKT